MGTPFPINLKGENLGTRHRYYNALVKEAVYQKTVLQTVTNYPETSPIDRIFKIDLASAHKDVDYILQNLKDDDMLYVSRALRSQWLLDNQYTYIINPTYLENNLFPDMIQPAVNKMKRWVQLHLTDPVRCQEFYEFYKDQFHVAIHFFWHCSSDFIVRELINISSKITPKHFKILCEICPQASEVYFETLCSDKSALFNYVSHEKRFFQNFKPILKFDGNLYLDVAEKYFNDTKCEIFNPSTTRYIMKHFRNRFDAKRELYTTMFLDMKTLAKHLTDDEAKDLIIQLARAEYLKSWFSYKKIEPLIKRIKLTERATFKKQIFVDKCIGPCIHEWPYSIPVPLTLSEVDKNPVFLDNEHNPYDYEEVVGCSFKKCIRKRKGGKYEYSNVFSVCKSPLDSLFDRYRFAGFDRTFEQLSKQVLLESNIDGRLNMLLVLVSKSGSVTEQVEKLLKWLVQKHINEPIHLRAAVVRSLIKRGCAWRLPETLWQLLLEFGRDLGLEGQTAELLCTEGLHAVVMRHLILNIYLPPDLITVYINKFSTFSEYKLSIEEKRIIGQRLASLIIDVKPKALLEVLREYKLTIKQIPGASDKLVTAARSDADLVRQLFDAKVCRRELQREAFSLVQNNGSYINVLRHDVSLLENGKSFATLVTNERPNHDRFLMSLSLYFNEPNGLAVQHKIMLENLIYSDCKSGIARPLCILSSKNEILDRLFKFDVPDKANKKHLQLAAAFRANAHKTKSSFNLNTVDWQWIGAKAVANKIFICRSKDRLKYIKQLLEWRRTFRISLRVAFKTPFSNDTFVQVSTIRSQVALKFALSVYFKNNYIDLKIWNVIKQIIAALDPTKLNKRILHLLSNNKHVPENIKADYWFAIYNMLINVSDKKAMPIICRMENILPRINENTIDHIVSKFIYDGLKMSLLINENTYSTDISLYVRIIAKHLLLCKTVSIQKERLEKVCEAFFDKIDFLLVNLKDKEVVNYCLNDFLLSLKYNAAFLEPQYVSCIPVFQKVLTRLRKIRPIEQYFGTYVNIHLTMLYYKSIKQAMKQKPNMFNNLGENGDEAIATVGFIFGNYIGHEIKELVSRYFFSIIDVYKKTLVDYLQDYFNYNDKKSMVVVFIVKGLIAIRSTEALILAEYILYKNNEYCIPPPHNKEILNALTQSKCQEIAFLIHCS